MAKPAILVFGCNGQVGREVLRAAPPEFSVAGIDRAEADITDPNAVARALDAHSPAIAINAAAYTAVDQAESERDRAFAVNRDGAGIIAKACAARGVALFHLSTDYVFDGTKRGAYVEDDPIAPLSVYGRSKAEGEAAVRAALDRHVILRTEWVYAAHGKNFVRTMLRLGDERDELRIVDDQRGSPTSARSIARTILAVARNLAARPNGFGTFHYTDAGETSWRGFAEAIFRHAAASGRRVPKLVPIATADYPTPARRPLNSVLDCRRVESVHAVRRTSWQEELAAVMDELLASAKAS